MIHLTSAVHHTSVPATKSLKLGLDQFCVGSLEGLNLGNVDLITQSVDGSVMIFIEGVIATECSLSRIKGYIELVGVELVFFLAHVVLLQFVEPLFLSLSVQELRVFTFIERWFLFFEHVVDEAIGSLFWVAIFLLTPSVVQELHLSLKSVLHFQVLALLHQEVSFLLPKFLLFLSLLDQINKLMLKFFIFSHFLIEEVLVKVINPLILFILPRLFGPVAVLFLLICFIFVELLNFLLSFLSAVFLLVLALMVECLNHVFSDRFSTLFLLDL